MQKTARSLKTAAVVLGVASALTLAGCANATTQVDEVRSAIPSAGTDRTQPLPSSSSSPSGSSSAVPLPGKGSENGKLEVQTVDQQTLLQLSSITVPKRAVEGSYIVTPGVGSFKTLTLVKFDSGETAYFATEGPGPIGSPEAGLGISADAKSKEVSAIGAAAPGTAAAKDAQDLLDQYGSMLG